MATPKKPSKKAAPRESEPLQLPPSNLRVRIDNPDHPHHGKPGWDTGEKATPPGSTVALHKVVWRKGGDEGCYVDPDDLVYPNLPKVKPGKPRSAEPARSSEEPSRRAAAWAIKQKSKARPTNGNPMQNAGGVQPHAESDRKPREPDVTCGAQNKQSKAHCRHPAGFRTDHPGSGKCWLHGGATPAPKGRYTSVRRPRIRELLEEFQADPDPLNLLPEVMLLRALVQDFIDRFDEQDQMLTRWNLSFEKSFQSDWAEWWREIRAETIERADDLSTEQDLDEQLLNDMPDPMTYLPSKPLRMADLTEAAGLIDKVGTMVERIRKARSTETFSMATIDLLWTSMAAHLTQAMLEVIEDDTIRSQLHTSVEEKWGTISLAELARTSAQGGAGEG